MEKTVFKSLVHLLLPASSFYLSWLLLLLAFQLTSTVLVNATETCFHGSTLLEMQVNVFTMSVFQVNDSTTCPACKKVLRQTLLHDTHCADMWDTETVRQTSPVDECQITDIHSVDHHQRLVQAVEHWASELTSSVAVLFVTAVQIQW